MVGGGDFLIRFSSITIIRMTNNLNPTYNQQDGGLIGQQQRKWPLGRFDCCSYKDSLTGSCMWCPFFFPMALFGAPCIVGRIQSRLMHEAPLCCDMGCSGWTCCCVSVPVSVAGPLGGFCYFSSLASVYRSDIEGQYNIEKPFSSTSEAGCFSKIFSCCYNAWTHPCVFFQLYMTLREIQNEKNVRQYIGNKQLQGQSQGPHGQQQFQQQQQQYQQQQYQQQQYQPQHAIPVVNSPVYAHAHGVGEGVDYGDK